MISKLKTSRSIMVIIIPMIVAAFATDVSAQENAEPEMFEAFAVVAGNIAAGASTTLQMRITDWTSEEDRVRLLHALGEKGAKEAVKDLQDMEDVGRIRAASGGVGNRLKFARQIPIEGGRRITLVTDRHIRFLEARQNPRTTDYDITLIQFEVNEEGQGQGIMLLGGS